jgi:DhnA family fructose-bisphosphate aldolase class Ia
MTPDACREWNLDGSKLLLRICDDDPNSVKTIQYCSEAITALNPLGLPIIVEPLPVVRTPAGHYRVVKDAEALAKIVGVASALGDSSRNLWLKLPYCPEFQVVASATTLPILLLGGQETLEPDEFISQLRSGLSSGNNVRGTMIGRNVLYPTDGDPVKAALRVHEVVHEVQQ